MPFELTVTIRCPDLLAAAQLLTRSAPLPSPRGEGGRRPDEGASSSNTPVGATVPNRPQPTPTTPPVGAAVLSTPQPTTPPTAPVAQPQPVQPVPPQPSQSVPPQPVQPQAPALYQISKAGADLVTSNPAAMPQLQALLGRFGIPAISALRPEQLAPFAEALRGLGAKI